MTAGVRDLEITDGVFFSRPATLPRGRHELSRDDVREAQQERIMIAATELIANLGLRAVGVREICARASVSQAAFYRVFRDKDECLTAAYNRFIAVLIERLHGRAHKARSWTGYVEMLSRAYLETLQADVVTARAFQVEMDALGRAARRRRRAALERVARFIRDERLRFAGEGEDIAPLREYLGIVYAVRQLASDALDDDETPNLLELVPGLIDAGQRLWRST